MTTPELKMVCCAIEMDILYSKLGVKKSLITRNRQPPPPPPVKWSVPYSLFHKRSLNGGLYKNRNEINK